MLFDKKRKSEGGFTLVELAIVMIIIGLLIGGILKGQELVNNAKIVATTKQLKSYIAAKYTFQDKYNSLPGDMNSARSRLLNCTIENNCYNGNGDSIVGVPTSAWLNNGNNISSENTQFWKHLGLADLITGANFTTNSTEMSLALPKNPIHGYYDVIHSLPNTNGDPASLVGLHVRIIGCINCPNTELPIGDQALIPQEATAIDRKLDDGNPMTGIVRTSSAGRGPAAGGCEDEYNETLYDSRRCVLYMQMW